MTKTAINYIKNCERISKLSIYLLVFLFPLFFLPWTSSVLNFNKQALLIFLVFISFFAAMIKILISGKLKISLTWLYIPLIISLLVLLGSTIFSLYSYGSFWGWPQSTDESFLTIFSLVLFYFLVISIFEKEEIFYLFVYFLVSSFLALLFGLFQFFGKYLLPFSFSKTVAFNTIGSTSDLAIFAAILIPLLILLIIKIKKRILKILFLLLALLSALVLIIINFSIAWWLVIVGSILTITLMAQRRDIIDNRWLILPMFFLSIALLFLFLKVRIPGVTNRSIEIFLNQKASADIALKTIKEYPVFGTGQGTFIFDFAKYKDSSFNTGQLWSVRFNKAGSEFFNYLTTTGILGILSLLTLFGLTVFLGIKNLFVKYKENNKEEETTEGKLYLGIEKKKELKEFFWVFLAGIFISFLVVIVSYFLYRSSLVLNFVCFLLFSSFVALVFPKKEFTLRPSFLATLFFNFSFTLFFVFGLGIFILEGQRYVAAVNYGKAISYWQSGKNKEAIDKLEGAVRINPKVDLYWRQLSQFYIQRIREISQNKKNSKDAANQQIQVYLSNAVNSAKAAVDTSPANVLNWSTRAFVYQSLIGIIEGTEEWAIKSYEEASRLEPLNPYYSTQEGLVYITQATFLPKEKKDEKIKLLKKAKVQFERAIKLKKDYAPAHFQLAMIYKAEGKEQEAIKRLEETKKISPFDVGLAFQLGLTYYQAREYQKAKRELERAILLNPNYSNALYFLGLTYNKLGENDKAIEKFEEVAELNPDNRQVKKILENLKSGKDIFKGLVQKQPPETPIKENSEENSNNEK